MKNKTITGLNDRIELNNGVMMPGLGVGGFTLRPEEEDMYTALRYAFEIGFRLVDTAEFYNTEKDVGKAIKDSKIPREDMFVCTKVWLSSFENVKETFYKSLKELDTDYVDMYFIHWPGSDAKLRLKVWDEILELYQMGLIKSPSVANFMPEHLQELIDKSGVAPASNQIELHPWYQQRNTREICKEYSINNMAWSPLAAGRIFTDDTIKKIAEKHDKGMAQVILRWDLQKQIIPIPKSVFENELLANTQIFDFELSKDEMDILDSLDGRGHCSYNQYLFDGDFEEADIWAKADKLRFK